MNRERRFRRNSDKVPVVRSTAVPTVELVAKKTNLLPIHVQNVLRPISKQFPQYQFLALDEVEHIDGGVTKVTLFVTDISSLETPQVSTDVLNQVGQALVDQLNSQTESELTATFAVVGEGVSITFTPNTESKNK